MGQGVGGYYYALLCVMLGITPGSSLYRGAALPHPVTLGLQATAQSCHTIFSGTGPVPSYTPSYIPSIPSILYLRGL